MNFNRLARLWNKFPQHIRMSDRLSSFKRQLGVLYKSHLIDFDINNRCTWGIICSCSGCDVGPTIILGSRNICSTLISPQPLLSELMGGKLFAKLTKSDDTALQTQG